MAEVRIGVDRWVVVAAAIAVLSVPAAAALPSPAPSVPVVGSDPVPDVDPPDTDPTDPPSECWKRSSTDYGVAIKIDPKPRGCKRIATDWTRDQACEEAPRWAKRQAPYAVRAKLDEVGEKVADDDAPPEASSCLDDGLFHDGTGTLPVLARSSAPAVAVGTVEEAGQGIRSRADDPVDAGLQSTPAPGQAPAPGGIPTLVVLLLAAALLPLLALYRRLSKDELLDNDLRREAVELLERTPGLTAGRVASALDVADSTGRYHLGLLEEFGLVETRETGNRTRYYVTGQLSRDEKRLARELTSETRRRIVAHLLDATAASPSELARRLDVARSTVAYHLDRLRDAGAVERASAGRSVRYRVPDPVRPGLEELGAEALRAG